MEKKKISLKIKEEKNDLRQVITARIESLSEADKLQQSQYVFQKVIENKYYKKSKSIVIYLHTSDEIHTHNLLKHIFENKKRCYIPRYNNKKKSMDMLELHGFDDLDSLPMTSWKIKQPRLKDTSRADALEEGVDMILMPGLGFSHDHDRLGRGGGFYDRYLTAYKNRHRRLPHLLAIAFREQICTHIPVEPTDVKIHIVIYEPEYRTLNFGPFTQLQRNN